MGNLHFALLSAGLAAGLFLGMLLFLELGRWFGVRNIIRRGDEASIGIGVVDTAVYGLLALLLGFTFNGAATRFDRRRDIVADEVNAIGTAWLRIDLLPRERQKEIRDGFRLYMDALLSAYAEAPGTVEEGRKRAALARAESDLWHKAVAAVVAPNGEPARMLLLPSLNESFDIVDMERMSRLMHPPWIVFGMLAVAAVAAALFAGYGMAKAPHRNWMYILGVTATVAIAVYVILELESSRIGWIRVDAMDQVLVELRQSME
jgi:hypothetical protein